MYDERDKNVIDNANVTITDAEETKQEQKEASGMNTEEAGIITMMNITAARSTSRRRRRERRRERLIPA